MFCGSHTLFWGKFVLCYMHYILLYNLFLSGVCLLFVITTWCQTAVRMWCWVLLHVSLNSYTLKKTTIETGLFVVACTCEILKLYKGHLSVAGFLFVLSFSTAKHLLTFFLCVCCAFILLFYTCRRKKTKQRVPINSASWSTVRIYCNVSVLETASIYSRCTYSNVKCNEAVVTWVDTVGPNRR